MCNVAFLIGRIFLVFTAVLLACLAMDELLLQSDFYSLSWFVALLLSFSGAGAVMLGGLVSLALHASRRAERIARVATTAPFAACVGGAVAILGQPVLWRLDHGWALPWIALGAGLAYGVVARKKTHSSPVMNRIGAGLLALGLIAWPAWLSANAVAVGAPVSSAKNEDGPRGLILVVVDALGAEYLSGLNGSSPVRTENIDSFLTRSTTYPYAHATIPDTYGAFSALYSGRVTAGGEGRPENLVAALQRAGVNVRIIASHLNAFPDNKQMRYGGLRSMLLSQNLSWIPKWGPIDYHIMTYRYAVRADDQVQGKKKHRLKALRDALNSLFAPTDPFDVAIDEIDSLVDDERPFLLLLHLFFNDTDESFSKPATVNLHPGHTDRDRAETNRSIREHSYRYTDEQAWWAAEYRAVYVEGVADFDRAFGRFVGRLAESGLLQTTDLILTPNVA